MNADKLQEEWNYIYHERLGISCDSLNASTKDGAVSGAKIAAAKRAADDHISRLLARLSAEAQQQQTNKR